MIDISLVEAPVSIDEFKYETPIQPSVFLGFIIKNEYDNKRLGINEKYNPSKFIRMYKNKGKIEVLPLYGICFKLNEFGKSITSALKKQEESYDINLVVYQNLLSEFSLSCNDCYGHFRSGIYPIDFNKFRYLTDDKIGKAKKILQRMLNLNDNKFDFQKFGSIISLIIT